MATRRLGTESSATRAQLIEAAKQILRQEGWAALTAGRIAQKIGLTRHTVHYYFGTIEDLLLEVIRLEGESARERLVRQLRTEEPISLMWELGSHATVLNYEFVGLAMRRPAIGALMRKYGNEFRELLAQGLTRQFELGKFTPRASPLAITLLIESISQTIAVERELGNELGHAETIEMLGNLIREYAGQSEAMGFLTEN